MLACFAFLFSVAEIVIPAYILNACYYRKGGGDGELTEIPLRMGATIQ